jgi:hypothetical protein
VGIEDRKQNANSNNHNPVWQHNRVELSQRGIENATKKINSKIFFWQLFIVM